MSYNKQRNMAFLYISGIVSYLFLYFTLYLSYQHEEYGMRQLPRFVFLVIAEMSYFALMLWCSQSLGYDQIKRQLLIINCFFVLTMLISTPIFFRYLQDSSYFGIFGFVSIGITLVCSGIINVRNYQRLVDKREIILAVAVCIVFIALGIYAKSHFSYFLWDSHDMFELIDDDNEYSLMNFKELSLSNHISYSFVFFAVIFKSLFGSAVTAQTYLGYVLYVIGVMGFWKCVNLFDDQGNKLFTRIVVTSVWACSPYMLGMITYSYIDFAMWCLYPLLVYCLLSKNYIYTCFWGTLYIFVKETALLFYVFLIVGYWLTNVCYKKAATNFKRYIILMIPCIPWLLSYSLVGHWNGSGNIAFRWAYFFLKLRTYFLINFNWLLLGIVLYGLIVAVVNKQFASELYQKLPITISALSYLVFSVIFETVNHPRYIDSIVSILYLCAAYVIVNNIKYNVSKIVVSTALAVVLLLQSFYTIDPIMKQKFRMVDVGNACVITTSEQLSDGMAYNRQYQNWGNVLDLALRDIDKENSDIYMATLYEDTWHFDAMGTYIPLNRENVVVSEAWDTKRKSRMADKNSDVLWFNVNMIIDGIDIELEDNKTAYYLYNELAGGDVAEYIKDNFQHEEQIFQENGWSVKRIEFRK